MKTNLCFLLLTAFSITGCHTYKEYDETSFPDYSWNEGQIIEFHPTIEDISKTYTLGIGLRHVYGLQQSTINVVVKIVSPSGKGDFKSYGLTVMDESGDYVSSCAGDMCDLETTVSEDIRFEEAGEYTFLIVHNEHLSKIAGITAVGLILDAN